MNHRYIFFLLVVLVSDLSASHGAKQHHNSGHKKAKGHAHSHDRNSSPVAAHKKDDDAEVERGLILNVNDEDETDEAHESVAERCAASLSNSNLPRASILTSLAALKSAHPAVHQKVAKAAALVEEHKRSSKDKEKVPLNVLQAMAEVEKFGRKAAESALQESEQTVSSHSKKVKGLAITALTLFIGFATEYFKNRPCKC